MNGLDLNGLDPALYGQPDGPVVRPWDRQREYVDTYPGAVPAQWLALGYPPPPRRRPSAANAIVLAILIVVSIAQVAGAFVTSARGVVCQ